MWYRVAGYSLLFATWLGGAGCARRLAATERSPTYELTRFKRRNPRGAPIIGGAIDQRQADGRRYAPSVASRIPNFAAVWVDGVRHDPRPDGKYGFTSTAGRHHLRVGLPGLVRVDVALRAKPGDSIRLDFHLRADAARLE